MAAVLSCGPEAVLSHFTAAALWESRRIGLAQSRSRFPRSPHPGITAHRRSLTAQETTVHHGIPVTAPATTIVDIAPDHRDELERAINEADKLDLIDPEALREAPKQMGPARGGLP